MIEKLWFLTPELVLFAAAVIVSVTGLSRSRGTRDLSPLIVILALMVAAILTPVVYGHRERLEGAGYLIPLMGQSVKIMVCLIGALLATLSVGLLDRNLERAIASGRTPFDAIRMSRGEYYAFFLLSLIGVMLVSSANDLIWLFLALELTSLPTYVMVAIARSRRISQEAAVKYFFLGAMSAAIFLFGFAFIYGATGTIVLTEIAAAFRDDVNTTGSISLLGLVGILLALLGLCFKIAAAPMHFYAADVYEGAASPVTAFLGFVPKTAGIVAIMLLLAAVGYTEHSSGIATLPAQLTAALFMIAVLTMTLGNVLALLQKSVKRVLAYSSIAHSGYLLIGIIAGPEMGFGAALFYLFIYGIMNTAAFAVLAALEKRGQEIDTFDDLAGLGRKHPLLTAAFAIASLSLLGFPPLLGFVGKFSLFAAGIDAGQILLVVIACFNSAISAWYYLKLAGIPILSAPAPQSEMVQPGPSIWPAVGAVIAAIALVTLWLFADPIATATHDAFAGLNTAARVASP
ncbi:MAG: NADH-quinone oxidoreductase subunit N [Phycisphaerales bacterium]